jgi:hypothetical protein
LPANSPVASLDINKERIVSMTFKAPYQDYAITYVRMSDLKEAPDWSCQAEAMPAQARPDGC